MDELCKWLRAEAVRGYTKTYGDPWDGGWECAIEEVIRRIPDFPDPPPRSPEPANGEEHRRNWDAYRATLEEWVARNAVSAEGSQS